MSESTAIATAETKKTNIAVGSQGMLLRSFDELWRFAVCCHKSGIAPNSYKSPEQIMIGLQTGMEIGFSPMASLKAIAVINGQGAIWGDAMKAAVERSPECEYVKEWIDGEGDAMTAFCEAKRRGRPTPTVRTFSVDDAKRAKLWQDKPVVRRKSRDGGFYDADNDSPWFKYPKRMLQMRARSWALRDQFADLLCGLAAAEEVQDYDSIEGQLLPGDPAPQQGVTALLASMDADDEPETAAVPPWEQIEAETDANARAIYDEYCGPDSTADEDTRERCTAAWRRRNGISEREEADQLFS